jgi:hypothetical protein
MVTVADDLDGAPPASTHTVGLEDRLVRVDLSAASWARLRGLVHLGRDGLLVAIFLSACGGAAVAMGTRVSGL